MTTLKARRTVTDNLGTRDHRIERRRIATPLTPRAVRMQMLAIPEWAAPDKIGELMEERRTDLAGMLTELDRLLSDEEAIALERFCDCEEARAGNARCPEWLAERVQTSAANYAPINDDRMQLLIVHGSVKRALPPYLGVVLQVFVSQQLCLPGAPSDAQAAIRLGIPGKHRSHAWHLAVKAAAVHLVAMRY